MKILLSKVSMVFLLALFSSTGRATDLTISISDLRSTEGKIRVGLFTSIKSYKKDSPEKAIIVNANSELNSLKFNDVDKGQYIIALFHDEDSNGKMNMKWFGFFPDEGYGFSNNPGVRFGPPDLDKALFNVNDETINSPFNIQMKY